jgi:hypothetical protein
MPGKHDPWLNGDRIAGVEFAHNSLVEIIAGPHIGQRGWLVTLDVQTDPLYTIELESGEDVDVHQSQIRAVR